ncbi:hypothetical protein [Rhodococcoides corynebacterioides]|uniref:LPXTG cell wall anchor domain-containing protein n=1 Tax=Rhodococcoides corynebacterioides TaxID=53972 RepID=A0ABS7P5Y6_9NOCA|nr:hypothetical protein [Rhodococcus corynebacterioides]MBY6367044.1 hypothetical protein [Rhodococcus corynebacterioides]MBY6407305.1 hypothetical protein [Rhodococcus corynebacterioides]
MTWVRWSLTLAGIVVGVAAVIAGGADDSPGLQGLGLLLVLGTIAAAVRARRRRWGPHHSRD